MDDGAAAASSDAVRHVQLRKIGAMEHVLNLRGPRRRGT
jgi:hypothetical protein